MKSKEEIEQIRNEYINLNKKLTKLTDDELKQVVGGSSIPGLETIGPCPYFSSSNLNSEGNQQKGSINEVIGEWDIHAKLKD